MKSIIDTTDWPQSRKNRVIDRIHDLEKEIDTDRVRYETIGALVIDGPDDIPGIVERWADAVRQVVKVFRKSKDSEDERRGHLPVPTERKQLEDHHTPKPKKKNGGSFDNALDDEISF